MLRQFQIVALTSITALFYVFAAGIGWCAFIDTEPPIEIVNGRVVEIDPVRDAMIVEWQVVWNRHCPGTRAGWIRTTAPEPPPRTFIPLGTVPLPAEGFSGTPHFKGEIISRRVLVPLNGYYPKEDAIYQAEWDYACNPVQAVFPLRVQSPFVEIKASVD